MPTAAARKVAAVRAVTHQLTGVGLAAAALAAAEVSTTTAAVVLGAAWVGSLLPDADLAGSRVYRRTPIERRSKSLRLLGALARLPMRLLTVLPHRGITHSIAACLLAAVATGALVGLVEPDLSRAAAAGVAVGYGAHIAADACTPAGVALLAPFSKRRRWLLPRRARVKTGSLREYGVLALAGALLVVSALSLAG